MPRQSLTLVALFAISFMAFVGYPYLTRPQSAAAAKALATAAAPVSTQQVESGAGQIEPTNASPSTPAEELDKLIAEATGEDARARAAAITALGTAPRLQAIPVLQRVLRSGEPVVDRPLALNSLRTLALQQGDADGGIRNVLRQAIYHGDDEATTNGAQTTLDDVEGYLSQAVANTHP